MILFLPPEGNIGPFHPSEQRFFSMLKPLPYALRGYPKQKMAAGRCNFRPPFSYPVSAYGSPSNALPRTLSYRFPKAPRTPDFGHCLIDSQAPRTSDFALRTSDFALRTSDVALRTRPYSFFLTTSPTLIVPPLTTFALMPLVLSALPSSEFTNFIASAPYLSTNFLQPV